MFTDVTIRSSEIATALGWDPPSHIQKGCYEINHFNFEMEIEDKLLEYENFKDINSYGVCDSLQQLLAVYDFDNDPRKICIALTRIAKIDQPADGGWRWHKWGPYIGNQSPQCEYLYDEKDIEEVFVYHIYVIKG